jgi:hypothetical protein
MQSTSNVGLTAEKLQDIAIMVRSAGAEAVRLRVVERFLSEVERRLLNASPRIFDVERVRTALQILKTLTPEDDIEEFLEAEFRLDQEFHLWRTLIEERDRSIETHHFRRFCDSATPPLGEAIYRALADFYRRLDPTPSVLSKFDLVMTRLFSAIGEDGRRTLTCPREQLSKEVGKILGIRGYVPGSATNIEAAVATIDLFTAEALELTDFESLVHSKIFDRYRDFKRDLEEVFFHPEIVAAAIDCNITVGTVFKELLAAADEKLGERLTLDVDLPGVLHDPSPDARAHVSELFQVFFGIDEDDIDEAVEDDLGFLEMLLAATSVGEVEGDAGGSDEAGVSAQDRLAPFLKTLTLERPDPRLLREQIDRFEEMRLLDLDDFLYKQDGSPDPLCRRVLGLILWSSEFRANELRQRRELSESTQQEAMALLRKAEDLAMLLRAEIDESDAWNANRILSVLNTLLESRIRFERSIVKYTSRNLAALPVSSAPAKTSQAAPTSSPQPAEPLVNKWLIAAIVLVLLLSGILYIVSQQF